MQNLKGFNRSELLNRSENALIDQKMLKTGNSSLKMCAGTFVPEI